jgi:hypothetical protein
VIVLACVMAPAAEAGEREIVRLDELTRAPLVLTGSARPQARSFPFRLPQGAGQGADRWYKVRLRFRIRFARDSGRGLAWVMADTNERTSAQIEFTTLRVRGRLRVRRTSVDIVRGQVERVSSSPTSRVTFENYLQVAGVRGGENVLSLRLEQAGDARVARLEIFGDTAIVATDRTPYPLGLSGRLLDPTPRVGDRLRIAVTLTNRTGESLRDVILQPEFDGSALRPLSPGIRRHRTLRRRVREVFDFEALRAGTHTVVFRADSSRNHPNGTLRVTVRGASRGGASPAVWVAALLPAILVGAWLVRARLGP